MEITSQSAPETGADEETSSRCVSDDRPGDCAATGAQDLNEEVATEEQDEQQAGEEGQEERAAEELEQDDPFADEDDDKENRAPEAFASVMENRREHYPAEEWSAFDESNNGVGIDLLEEVLEF